MFRKKRLIKVQSKNKFPSDFFDENSRLTQNTQPNNDEDTFSNNFKFFGNESKNKNTSFQKLQINQQNQVNSMEISSQMISQLEIESDQQLETNNKDNTQNIYKAMESFKEKSSCQFKQIQIPQNTQLIQRPFISARGSRTTKSQTILPLQALTPLSQKKRGSKVSKDNFIEQKQQKTLNSQQLSTFENSFNQQDKNNLKKQLNTRTNVQSSQSTYRLNSVQIPNLTVSPNKTLSILSPTSKNQQENKESSSKEILITNSPKNSTCQQLQQKQSQIIQQSAKTNSNLKRNSNYQIQSSANLHQAINKGSYSCRSAADKKEKSFNNSQNDQNDSEMLEIQQKIAINKFMNRKPVVVNKQKSSNIDFTNFKMPLNSITQKIKEISSQSNGQQKLMKAKSYSQANIEQIDLKSQTALESIQDTQIEECIDDQISLPSEGMKEEQTFEIDNSDSTKNSIQQNNTILFQIPSVQNENLYLFSDKNIKSTQNSMIAFPIPQLKQFNSDISGSQTLNQLYSPILQNQLSSPQQISNFNDQSIFNFQSKKSSNQQNGNQQSSDNQIIQVEINQDNNNINNNYNITANFSDAKGQHIDFNIENKEQKQKQSQKSKPKIALSFKESEKFKPFLIRKMNSQCSMRVKYCNLNDYSGYSSNCNQSNNIIFDFTKNGSASTTHGTSNEYINSHEFSFSNS